MNVRLYSIKEPCAPGHEQLGELVTEGSFEPDALNFFLGENLQDSPLILRLSRETSLGERVAQAVVSKSNPGPAQSALTELMKEVTAHPAAI
jgi:hypothetical protein